MSEIAIRSRFNTTRTMKSVIARTTEATIPDECIKKIQKVDVIAASPCIALCAF
jgi:hypothetical protein